MKTLKEWKKWIAAALCVALVFTQTGPVSYADESENEIIENGSLSGNNDDETTTPVTPETPGQNGDDGSLSGNNGSQPVENGNNSLSGNNIDPTLKNYFVKYYKGYTVDEQGVTFVTCTESYDDEELISISEDGMRAKISEHENNENLTDSLLGYTGDYEIKEVEATEEELELYPTGYTFLAVIESYRANFYPVTIEFVDLDGNVIGTRQIDGDGFEFKTDFVYDDFFVNDDNKNPNGFRENENVITYIDGETIKKYGTVSCEGIKIDAVSENICKVVCKELCQVDLWVQNINYEIANSSQTVYVLPGTTVEKAIQVSKFNNINMDRYTSDCSWNMQAGEIINAHTQLSWSGITQSEPYIVRASRGNIISKDAWYNAATDEFTLDANWDNIVRFDVVEKNTDGNESNRALTITNSGTKNVKINLNGNKRATIQVDTYWSEIVGYTYYYVPWPPFCACDPVLEEKHQESIINFDKEEPCFSEYIDVNPGFCKKKTYSFGITDRGGVGFDENPVSVYDKTNNKSIDVTYENDMYHYETKDRNHVYEIKVVDRLGNTFRYEFTENQIATESAAISVFNHSVYHDTKTNITAVEERCASWINKDDELFLLIKPDPESKSDIVSASYSIGGLESHSILGEGEYIDGNGEGREIQLSGFSGLPTGTYSINVSAKSALGVEKNYIYYVSIDATEPEYRNVSFSTNVYENTMPNSIKTYGHTGNLIGLDIDVSDAQIGVDKLVVSGFSVFNTIHTIDLKNASNPMLNNNTLPSEVVLVAPYGNGSSKVSILLYTENLRILNEDINIKVYDKVGNVKEYNGWGEREFHISDGISPEGTWAISKDDNEIVVTTGFDENNPTIVSNGMNVSFAAKDEYLFGISSENPEEYVLDYCLNVMYTAEKGALPRESQVQFENDSRTVNDTDGMMEWNANLLLSGNDSQGETQNGIFVEDGLYVVGLNIKDAAGNAAKFTNDLIEGELSPLAFSVYYDITPPSVEVSSNVEAGEDTWVNTDVKISGTATDAKWGKVDAGYYTRISSTSDTAPEFNAPASKDKCAEYKTLSFENGNFSVTNAATDEFNGYYYFWAYDTVGNVSEVKSVRVRVDSTAPEAELKVDTSIIYNEDVEVEVSAKEIKEAGLNSGLKQISYEIYNGDKVTSTGTMSGVEGKDSYTGTIKVVAKENEGDKVSVKIVVTDIAGNEEKFTSEPFKIDVTKPVIEVSYDNNDASNDIYFHASRTATVVITEHNFDADKVKFETTGTIGAFTSNGDEHVAKVTFAVDGEHTIAVSCVDKAKNESEETKFSGVSPKEFTVDLTNPKVTITYSNNSSRNGNYYNDGRVATIAVIERNFDAASATAGVIVKNLSNGSVPVLSGWSTSGDAHTATLSFTDDAEYEIEISFEDLATNVSETVEPEKFVLDQLLPVVNIAGVSDHTAYNAAEVAPVITVSDTNYDVNGVIITLTGVVDSSVATLYPTASADLGYAHRFEFANIEEDGLYTLSVQVTDLAGNVTDAYISEDGSNYNGNISFSVNRNGSVYTVSEDTKKVLVKFYLNEEKDIVITETNVDILTDMQILVSKDNNQTALADLTGLTGSRLEEGTGYTVERSEVKGGWSQYTYTISKDNFTEDGVYHVALCSTDAAGNTADSELAEETMGISFVVDKTAPIYIVSDLESGVVYDTDEKVVTFTAKDNIALEKVKVYVNGEETASWSEEEIREIQSRNADFNFTIYEDVTEQTVMITCVDKAGNHSEEVVIDQILVTTNWFVRFKHNDNLVAGTSVAAAVVFTGGVTGFGFRRRRRLK